MRLGVFQFSTRKFPLEWKRRIFMALAGEQAPVAADQAGHNIDALKGTGFHNRSACEKRSLKCRKLARLEGFEPPTLRSEVRFNPQQERLTEGKSLFCRASP